MQKISPVTVFRTSGMQLLIQVFSCEYSKSFRDSGGSFWITFYCQKDFFKKKVIGEFAFDLISLFHVQIQEPKLFHVQI